MARILIAGPCLSEFGWELMEFQGRVRRLAHDFDRVVISSTAGHEPIYADMNPADFIGHYISGRRDCHRMRPGSIANPDEVQRIRQTIGQSMADFKNAGHVVHRIKSVPERGPVGHRCPVAKQVFVKYGDASRVASPYPVVIHARNRLDGHSFSGDNYPEEHWVEMLQLLAAKGFSRVAAMGTLAASLAPAGSVDLRGIRLQATMDIMAAASVVVGPSSGPMHLASLCGTPHIVWTGSKRQPAIGVGNKARYEQLWNPLKTPVHVLVNTGRGALLPAKIAEAVLRSLEGR